VDFEEEKGHRGPYDGAWVGFDFSKLQEKLADSKDEEADLLMVERTYRLAGIVPLLYRITEPPSHEYVLTTEKKEVKLKNWLNGMNL